MHAFAECLGSRERVIKNLSEIFDQKRFELSTRHTRDPLRQADPQEDDL
jgi:hypothetical protein